MARGRSWPVAVGLVLFVVVLGALPHARFSLLLGQPTFFLSAYDEDLYAVWALVGGGPLLPHRFLSDAALMTLVRLCGGSWNLALIAADAVFPAVGAVLAWALVGRVTRRRLPRLAIALGLLFAQELFSFGCWTIWRLRDPIGLTAPDAAPWDLRAVRAALPEALTRLWPDYAGPFLTIFRTPEPQLSRILLFATLLLVLRLAAAEEERRTPVAALTPALALNAILAFTYFFQAAAIAGLEASFALALAVLGRRRGARRVGVLAAAGIVSVALGILAYHSGAESQTRAFASRLPVVTPATAGALAGLGVVVAEWRRGRRDPGLALASACFLTVLAVTNQQLVTGRMVSSRDWERSLDYPLVFVGAAIVGASLVRRWRVSERILYAMLGAGVLATVQSLVGAQQALFEEEYLARNLESVALQRAVEAVEARGVRPAVWILQKPELSLLLEVRLQRPFPHLLEAGEVFTHPVPSMSRPGGAWGARSRFARPLFEYFARESRTPAAVERLLAREADAGGGTFLTFLFALDEWWASMTDGRATQGRAVRTHLPDVREAYARYLQDEDACWARSAVVLTREGAADRARGRWTEAFLLEATVGPREAPPLMNMNAYLQAPPPGSAPPAPGACD